MAPKQPAALKNPPPADTSSEEEEESDEEVPETQTKTPQKPDSSEDESDQSSSDEEEEEDKENKKPSVDKSDSDSDEEDEEDEPEDKNKSSVNKSDSGSDEDDADAAGSDTESADTAPLKVEEPKEVVKPKPVEVVIASPAVKSSVSNQKKGKASGADEKKSPAFTRVFGDDDEVAVLKGMDEFRKKTGRDPNVDRDGFFEFMKKSLKIEVSKSQLMDKVRRLKKKYQNHEKKGKDPVITKPHELKLYELSKKVWSGDVRESATKPVVKRKAVKDAGSDVGSEVAKSNKKAKAKMSVDLVVKENGAAQGGLELGEKVKSEAEEGWDAYPYCKEALEVESSGYYFKRCLDFNKIGAKKAKEMDDLCRAYHVKELELKSARVEVQEKITKLLHDTLKS